MRVELHFLERSCVRADDVEKLDKSDTVTEVYEGGVIKLQQLVCPLDKLQSTDAALLQIGTRYIEHRPGAPRSPVIVRDAHAADTHYAISVSQLGKDEQKILLNACLSQHRFRLVHCSAKPNAALSRLPLPTSNDCWPRPGPRPSALFSFFCGPSPGANRPHRRAPPRHPIGASILQPGSESLSCGLVGRQAMGLRCLARCRLLLAVAVLAFAGTASALYEDQVGINNWHKKYVGAVKTAVVTAKRVYVSTEQNVFAGISSRFGTVGENP